MFRVLIKDKAGKLTNEGFFESQALADDWILDCVSQGVWGKPERWVTADQEDVSGALEQKVETNDFGVQITKYKLPATYTIDVVDLSQDQEWCLSECHKNRLTAYPSLGELADALVKKEQGDLGPLNEYVAKCLEVKTRFPKP